MTYGVSEQLAELFRENAQRHAWQRDCASSCVAAAERRAAALSVKVALRAAEL